ncbi:MAG TPA: adenylate kinase [Cyanobacteria bacterium UBA8803]|nr:adenylate kinase [Cyanobacteria bacterium UBA9273]HBL58234.1 adenylate kinase [Cyanobacteria bacterium UBA8803]
MDSYNSSYRISVVGTTGSGKTTLARHISQYLAIPHVELDAFNHEPNWQEASTDVFRKRVEESLNTESWVVDGNYSRVRDIVWHRANTVIWLDYSLPVIMSRLMWRTFWRVVKQEELWNGNRETWQRTFSRESILLWALTTYRQKRKNYPLLFQKPEYAHLQVIHLRSPKATSTWLASLAP